MHTTPMHSSDGRQTRVGTDFIPNWHIPDDWWNASATAELTSNANAVIDPNSSSSSSAAARDRKDGVLVPSMGVFEATALEPVDFPTGEEYIAQTRFRRDLASQFSLLGLGLGSRHTPKSDVRLDVISTSGNNMDWDDLDDLRAGTK